MAKKTNKLGIALLGCLFLVIGLVSGFSAFTYINIPKTDEVTVGEDVYYTNGDDIQNDKISLEDANMSVHFLELGNKYTGDCTYIKTDTCDILIDCGSKSNSIP